MSTNPFENETALAEHCAQLLSELRTAHPLVQCLTNHVVSGFTANVLLSLGAAPAMVDIPIESGMFAGVASGVLINIGTLAGEQAAAMREAATAACGTTPWVLDPVAVGALPVRTALAAELLIQRPNIVRGNASEILAVSGAGVGGRGVDTNASVNAAATAAAQLAQQVGGAVAVSGPVDLITDGNATVRVSNGHEMLTVVTGAGCALGAVMAAFAGLCGNPLLAATAASTVYGIAAEKAITTARGPGSFAVALLDALAAVQPGEVLNKARLELA
jgi:hydroxyethylthiazole kinase